LTELQISTEKLIGTTLRDFFGEEAYATIEPYITRALLGEKVTFERQAQERGSGRYFLYHYVPDIDQGGRARGFYAMVTDITQRKNAELKLFEEEKLLRGLTDNLPALVSYIDREGRFGFNNKPYEIWLGKSLSEITGRTVREVFGDEEFFKYKRFFDLALIGEKSDFAFSADRAGEKHYYNAAYVPQFGENGEVVGVCSMISDITELKKIEIQLTKMTRVDPLTGLANRVQFDENIRKAIARSRRSGLPMALMYLDIDHFKAINDTLGHQAGDLALREFSKRLQASVRKTDQVARLSGDEFVVLTEEMKTVDEAEIVAFKIIQSMKPEFSLDGQLVAVTTSIGIALLHDDDDEPQSLLRRADRALYRAKTEGRNVFRSE